MIGEARPVHVFVMAGGVFDNVFGIRRERNFLQHLDCRIDVRIDFLGFLGCPCALRNNQIMHFAAVAPVKQMIGAVLQKRFARIGFRRHIVFKTFQFVFGQSQSLVEMPEIRLPSDLINLLNIFFGQRRIPFVRLCQKSEIVFQSFNALIEFGFQLFFRPHIGQAFFQIFDMRIAI